MLRALRLLAGLKLAGKELMVRFPLHLWRISLLLQLFFFFRLKLRVEEKTRKYLDDFERKKREEKRVGGVEDVPADDIPKPPEEAEDVRSLPFCPSVSF